MATDQVKNDGGVETAEKIIADVQAELQKEFRLMYNAWEDLRPWYRSRGATTFYAACDEISQCFTSLDGDIVGVREALRMSNALLTTFTEEDQQAAMKVAGSDNSGGPMLNLAPSYNITTVT